MTIRSSIPSVEYRSNYDLIFNQLPNQLPTFGYITTYTGNTIQYEDPDPKQICIQDIAHALSQQCRFAGHTKRFLSVAEHSILVSLNCPPELALEGLLHDASEAYMVDMPTPIKRKISKYGEYEDRLEWAIARRFDIEFPINPRVKEADTAQLIAEARALLVNHSWTLEFDCGLTGFEPRCLSPEQAEQQFLNRFEHLLEKRKNANP